MHDETKIEEIIKNAHIKSECTDCSPVMVENLMKQYAEQYASQRESEVRKQTIDEMKKYHENQAKIHQHIIDIHEQAPFKWHEGARDEAKKTLQALTEL